MAGREDARLRCTHHASVDVVGLVRDGLEAVRGIGLTRERTRSGRFRALEESLGHRMWNEQERAMETEPRRMSTLGGQKRRWSWS